MKIITFGDYNYIPHIISSYRNLKNFNRQNDLLIFGTDIETVLRIKQIEPDCNVDVFTSKRYNLNDFKHDDEAYYCILQYIKQEILQHYLEIYDKLFYLDSDVIVFKDFFDIIELMLSKHDLALKFYLQSDRFKPGTLRSIVNCGTFGVKKSEISEKMFEYFFKQAALNTPKGNLDEYHLTNFLDEHTTNHAIIDDTVNLINNERMSYRVDDIVQLSPMSFHPTYTINRFYPDRPYTKIGIAKLLNKWFYE